MKYRILFFLGIFNPANWFRKVKPVEIPTAGIAHAYHKCEEAVKMLEYVKFTIEDTKDFEKMSEDNRKLSKENLERFFTRTQFQATCLRDELLLTLQRMPQVKLVRKGQREQKQKEALQN